MNKISRITEKYEKLLVSKTVIQIYLVHPTNKYKLCQSYNHHQTILIDLIIVSPHQ
jgi:hypothetical protein